MSATQPTEPATPGSRVRLISQVECDERGNFHYQGDLFRNGENSSRLLPASTGISTSGSTR